MAWRIMDRMGRFVAASAAVMVVTVVVLVALTSISPPYDTSRPLLVPAMPTDGRDATDEPLRLSALDGEAPTAALGATWGPLRVILVKVPVDDLRVTAEATGFNTGQYAVTHPSQPDLAILAYDAASTHLGCSVDLIPTPGHRLDSWRAPGQETVVLMDICHHGMWDVLAGAAPNPRTPAPTPLAVVPIALGPGDDPLIMYSSPIEQPRAFAAYERGTFRMAS